MHRWLIALLFVATAGRAQTGAGSAGATGAAGTIDPGMTRAQVIERLGKPATVRNYQGSTYLMYANNCGRKCGMQDIVILDHDVVVDAMFRSPNRHYTGTSSSPDATKANSRTQRNQPLAVPEPSAGKAEVVPPSNQIPRDSARTSTSYPPADSARTSTSRVPRDSARTSTSQVPKDSARTSTSQVPKDSARTSTSQVPMDSARTPTSYPPADSAPRLPVNPTTSTNHPPKPPQ